MSDAGERFTRLMEMVGAAAVLPRDERRAWLESECSGDSALLHEALDLLEHAASDESLQSMTSVLDAAIASTAFTVGWHAGVPETIGPFRILEVLGEGGMGIVYGARQEAPLLRDVAIKVVRGDLHGPRVVARFEAERRTLAALDHPNIARVFEAGSTVEGLPYLAMEWVRGEPVTAYCTRRLLTLEERLALFKQVLSAVQYAHQRAVVHRDIKPTNVLVTDAAGAPVAKVIDFGIARVLSGDTGVTTAHTAFGARIGTLEYMSPEQALASGDGVDTRSDIYSLGVLLYELLTGRLPIAAESLRSAGPVELERLLRDTEPPIPSSVLSGEQEPGGEPRVVRGDVPGAPVPGMRAIPRELDWIVMRALAKDLDRRYQSVRELALDLERLRRNEPVSAAPPGPAYRVRKFLKRRRGPAIAALAVALALVGGSAMAAVGLVRARSAQALAEREAARAASVSTFLGEMLGAARPERARGEDVTVRAVLDWAASRLDTGEAPSGDPYVEGTVRMTVAESYIALGELERARVLLEPSVERLRAAGLDADSLYGRTLNWMSWLYSNLGDAEGALPYAEEAVALRERTAGRLNAGYTEALGALANAHRQLGHLATAESLLVVAVEIDRQLDPADLSFTLHSLGAVQAAMERFNESASSHREAIAIRLQEFGEDSPYLVASLTALAGALTGQGRAVEALDTLGRALELGEVAYGPDHPRVAAARLASAMPLLDLGRVDDAELALRRALPPIEATFGADSWRVGEVTLQLGRVHVARGDEDAATRSFTRAWELIAGELGPTHNESRAAASELARLYAARGMAEPASTWRERADAGNPGAQP